MQVLFDKRAMFSLFRFGTELLGKLPSRGDGLLGSAVKLLAIADAHSKVYGNKGSAYADIFARYDLRERTSDPFVRLFFGTHMGSAFRLRRHGISEHLELIEAMAPDGERLFFQEHRYGAPEVSSEFFHTPGFDFQQAMRSLWSAYSHGLYLSVVAGRRGWGTDVSFCALQDGDLENRTSVAEARIADLATELDAGPRTVLLYGPPGTGKSSAAIAVARRLGGALLKIDAASLPQLGIQELGFLLDALRPRFLVIDDFDRAPVEEARARILFLFERLKAVYKDMSVFVTVNNPAKLDAAILSSHRIDLAVEIGLPDFDERREILRPLGDWIAHDVACRTVGFNRADLAALVERSRREPVEKVLDSMQRLRDLAAKASAADLAPGDAKPATPV